MRTPALTLNEIGRDRVVQVACQVKPSSMNIKPVDSGNNGREV
jgi:hypothetical protein